MGKRLSLKLVGALVDGITEDDSDFEDVQADDEVVGDFPEELRELYKAYSILCDQLLELKQRCGGGDGTINLRRKTCRRCESLQFAIQDLEHEMNASIVQDEILGQYQRLEVKKGWKLVAVESLPFSVTPIVMVILRGL